MSARSSGFAPVDSLIRTTIRRCSHGRLDRCLLPAGLWSRPRARDASGLTFASVVVRLSEPPTVSMSGAGVRPAALSLPSELTSYRSSLSTPFRLFRYWGKALGHVHLHNGFRVIAARGLSAVMVAPPDHPTLRRLIASASEGNRRDPPNTSLLCLRRLPGRVEKSSRGRSSDHLHRERRVDMELLVVELHGRLRRAALFIVALDKLRASRRVGTDVHQLISVVTVATNENNPLSSVWTST